MARPTEESRQEAQALYLEGLRRCCGCNEVLPETEFGRHERGRFGFAGRCKPCINEQNRRYYHENKDPAKVRKKSLAAYYKQTPEHRRRVKWKSTVRRYGIEMSDWHRMLKDQQGRCEICSVPMTAPRSPHIDHCHAVGHVRGLLCSQCNVGLGSFRDSPEFLRAAAVYLERPLC